MDELNDRIKRINRRIGQLISAGERDVARKYAGALIGIRAILADQYERYEQGGSLSYDEMLKHDRLNKLMKRVKHLLRSHYKNVNGDMERILGGAYEDGYYLTAWAVETSVKAKIGFSTVRPETLKDMLDNPVAGLTLNQRLEKQRANIIYDIQQQVTQGLQKNETYSIMARRLKKTLEGDAVKAMRIVRTEGHRVQESAKLDVADKANKSGVIMMKQWNTLEDSRVRNGRKSGASHVKLNNVKIPVDENFDDGVGIGPGPGQMGAAASDINCRCFLTYSVERVEKPNHDELESMTFSEWEKERLL